MKLGGEHLGKKVRRTCWDLDCFLLLEWVSGKNAAGILNPTRPLVSCAWTTNSAEEDDWSIVEEPKPKKLPSERFAEIKFNEEKLAPKFSDSVDLKHEVRILELDIRALLKLLDEKERESEAPR